MKKTLTLLCILLDFKIKTPLVYFLRNEEKECYVDAPVGRIQERPYIFDARTINLPLI